MKSMVRAYMHVDLGKVDSVTYIEDIASNPLLEKLFC